MGKGLIVGANINVDSKKIMLWGEDALGGSDMVVSWERLEVDGVQRLDFTFSDSERGTVTVSLAVDRGELKGELG